MIATSRIDNYDGENVTFHYSRHEDNVYVEETVPATEFIERLIRHIPEKHFKMIRYGGLYARHRESDKKLNRAIPKEKHAFIRSFNEWRTAILELKVDSTPKKAIQQIKEKKYALRFKGKLGEIRKYTGRILAVGISYSNKTKEHKCSIEIL